jgi:two-component system chemotaxis response regulator CheY
LSPATLTIVCQCGEKPILLKEPDGWSFVCPKCLRTALIPTDINCAEGQVISLKPLKVLLVEDSVVLRKILRKTLEDVNYEVVEATDGKMAFVVARHGKPDIIILDYNMPNKNGIECLKDLKEWDETKNIPAMMCTSNADRDMVMNCMRAGASDYVVKPVKDNQLLEKVGRLAGMIKSLPYEITSLANPSYSDNTAVENPVATTNPITSTGAVSAETAPQAPDENPRELFRRLPYNVKIQRVVGFYIGEIGKVYSVDDIARKSDVEAEWLTSVLPLFKEAGFFKFPSEKIEFVRPFRKEIWQSLVDWALDYIANGEDASGSFERFFKY